MADIKDLGIFNKTNNGMNAIKKASSKTDVPSPTPTSTNQVKKVEKQVKRVTVPKEKTVAKAKRSVGAPIKNYDRTHTLQQPIKISPILNATTRSLVKKYETSLNKDELLWKALDFYVKQNLTKEDKIDLLCDVTRDLYIFREKHPTIEMVDEDGMVLKTTEEIESDTVNDLKTRWGIEKS